MSTSGDLGLGPLAAFLVSVSWSLGVSAYSRLSTRYVPSVVNTTRAAAGFLAFLIGGLVLLGPTGFFQELLSTPGPNLVWLATSMLASFAFGDFLFLLSAREIGVAGALALASVYPLWSALAGWGFRGEKLGPLGFLGLCLIVGGVVLVVLGGIRTDRDKRSPEGPSRYWLGVSLGLVTSVFWALNTFATSAGGTGLPLVITNVFRMGFALILCPLMGWLLVRQRPALVSRTDLKSLWPVFLIESAGGTFFYMYAMTHAPLAVASALSSLAPALIAPIAWIMKWEPFSFQRLLGILGIVTGIVFLLT